MQVTVGRRASARRSRLSRATLAFAIALTGALASPGLRGDDASAEGRYRSKKTQIAPGLVLVKKYDNKLKARIRILRVDPSTDLTIDLALSNDELPRREKTTSMAARHGALAAVNASIGSKWGRPIGVFAEDGSLKSSPLVRGGAFSMSRDESIGQIGYPRTTVRAHNLTSDVEALWVADWNDQFPNPNKLAGYTQAGGSVVKPPRDACSARLFGTGRLRWAPDKDGISRTYNVRKVRCRERPMGLNGGVVLAAPQGSPGAKSLRRGVDRGDTLNLTWSVGWSGAMDVVGGSPVLMLDGKIIAQQCGGYVCKAHPRTGVGVTPGNDILLVTVDGRQTNSKGMTILQFARLFKKLGAKRALNLDGGGSTTMVVEDNIVNKPVGSERSVASALLVLPGPDRAEPEPGPPLATSGS